MLKLNKSEFLRQKQFQSAGFAESDFPSVEKFLKYSFFFLPLVGIAREVALSFLWRKIVNRRRELIARCDNSNLDDARWMEYRMAHRKLTGYLNLLERHN